MTGDQILPLRYAIAFLWGLLLLAPTVGSARMPSPEWPSNKVLVAPSAILMPPGKVLLIRKDGSIHGAVKFLDFWTGRTEEDWFAEYESYYLSGSKDRHFGGKDLVVRRGSLSSPKPRGIGRLAFSFGKKEIRCGPVKLYWSGRGSVHFYSLNQEEGDHGIELAPTNWSSTSEVDLSDPRIQWYRYDSTRKRTTVFIDELWTEDQTAGP